MREIMEFELGVEVRFASSLRARAYPSGDPFRKSHDARFQFVGDLLLSRFRIRELRFGQVAPRPELDLHRSVGKHPPLDR